MNDALIEAVVLLGAALLFVLLFRRIGLGAVLGYLVAGAVVGPFGLRLVGGGAAKLQFAELGIALLLFLIGMELSPERLWRLRREIFGLGIAQLLLCGAALFAFVYAVSSIGSYGFTWQAALAIALPLALSSTAQVLPSLKASGRINSPFGERAFSILLLQDLSIVPFITIIAALSRAPADPAAPPGWLMALYTVGAVAGLVLAGRLLVGPVLRQVGRIGDRELFVVVGLFVVLAAAGLMHILHLSIALGAFVAGVMLADSPYRHELEAVIEPFRSILLGLFFLAVGMVLDVDVIRANPLLIIAMAAGLVAIKTLILWLVARGFGMDGRPALALALLLSQGGEFGFVLFAQASDALLIRPAAASLFSAVVTLSMASTPFLMLFARRLEYRRTSTAAAAVDLDGPDVAPRGRAIVVGYGRFGQLVAQMLASVDCSVTLVDRKPQQIELSGSFDVKVYYGDGLRLDVLQHAGADEAQLIALCVDGDDLRAEQVQMIVDAFPNARVVARVFARRHLVALSGALPGEALYREVYESALAMGIGALEALDIDAAEVADAERAVRQVDMLRLAAQIDTGDMRAGIGLRITAGSGKRPREWLELLAERIAANAR